MCCGGDGVGVATVYGNRILFVVCHRRRTHKSNRIVFFDELEDTDVRPVSVLPLRMYVSLDLNLKIGRARECVFVCACGCAHVFGDKRTEDKCD